MTGPEGLLLVDKPRGVTSHDVVQRVRRFTGQRRTGHAGTLDPMATGLLVIGLGLGTRLLQFLAGDDKVYRGSLRLGTTTDTQDAEGRVVASRPWDAVTPEAIREASVSFLGEVSQVPPMFSALKKDGVALHKLARKGLEVERRARDVEIRRLDLLRIDLPEVEFEVECSKGTYVRTLANDLGEKLGCGAHLTALRRLRSGPYGVEESLDLAGLEGFRGAAPPAGLIPLDRALRGFPRLQVELEAARRLLDGVPPEFSAVSGNLQGRQGETVALHHGDQLLAVARFDPTRSREERGDFELLRVLHRPLAA